MLIKNIFVNSFVNVKNIRIPNFNIRFTPNVNIKWCSVKCINIFIIQQQLEQAITIYIQYQYESTSLNFIHKQRFPHS